MRPSIRRWCRPAQLNVTVPPVAISTYAGLHTRSMAAAVTVALMGRAGGGVGVGGSGVGVGVGSGGGGWVAGGSVAGGGVSAAVVAGGSVGVSAGVGEVSVCVAVACVGVGLGAADGDGAAFVLVGATVVVFSRAAGLGVTVSPGSLSPPPQAASVRAARTAAASMNGRTSGSPVFRRQGEGVGQRAAHPSLA